jgi:hypothetical protein
MLTDGGATYTGAEDCMLTFAASGSSVVVTQKGSCPNHGSSGSIVQVGGTYQPRPTFAGQQLGSTVSTNPSVITFQSSNADAITFSFSATGDPSTVALSGRATLKDSGEEADYVDPNDANNCRMLFLLSPTLTSLAIYLKSDTCIDATGATVPHVGGDYTLKR